MKEPVENLRAIVTGGARGIGLQICRRLLFKAAKAVAILDLNPTDGAKSVTELNAEFGANRSFFIQTDVSKPQEFEENFNKAVKQLGGLDILVNNAGIINEPNWELVIDVNVKAVIQGTLLAIEAMGKHKGGKGGTVVNMGSTCAFVTFKCLPIYCGSKAAVLGFSRSIALSYEKTGVSVKVMCPGFTATDLAHSTNDKFLSIYKNEKHLHEQYPEHLSPESIATQLVRLIEETPNGTAVVCFLRNDKYSLGIAKIPELDDIVVPL